MAKEVVDEIKKVAEEDLGIKLGTDDEIFWTERLEACDKAIEVLEGSLKLERAIREMAESKIAEEEKK